MPLLVAAAIPLIWWHQGPDTASRLQQAALSQVCLAPEVASAWSGVSGAPATCSGAERTKLPAPRIDRKIAVASATTSPWIVANGWRFLRSPGGSFLSEPPAGSAPLAMSEAFSYRAEVAVKIADSDLPAAASFQRFLSTLPDTKMAPIADVTFVDDGTALAGEALNLMVRRNLLVRTTRDAEPVSGSLRVKIGDSDFPKSLATNPDQFAIAVRRKLTDEKRSIRVYGSEMVLARLEGSGGQRRLHLINYNRNAMEGLRIRIRGEYASIKLFCFGYQGSTPEDVSAAGGFTEFSIPEFKEYAFVELR